MNSLLNCEIGGLDGRDITTEFRVRVECIHTYHLFCNALVHVIYSRVYWSMIVYNTDDITFSLEIITLRQAYKAENCLIRVKNAL